jgi:hypothetical protein
MRPRIDGIGNISIYFAFVFNDADGNTVAHFLINQDHRIRGTISTAATNLADSTIRDRLSIDFGALGSTSRRQWLDLQIADVNRHF